MADKLFGSHEIFERAPLLALLPSEADLTRLENFAPALFARFETVLRALDAEDESERRSRLQAEERMLRVVLAWLEMRTESSQVVPEDGADDES